MLGKYENVDRRTREPNLEPIDVVMLTLDAEIYLERCLDSAYREVPVDKMIVVDSGSKDKTLEILNKYPRMEIHVRPDIRTTGKCLEFAFTRVTNRWILWIDADNELPLGWYDEMLKYTDEYDFFGCKRIDHYEFCRVNPRTVDINYRPLGGPFLARSECFRDYHVDDDYMWGVTDFLLRQVAEKNGYRFGKISSTYHYHHTTDNMRFESDPEKRGRRMVFQDPEWEIVNKANWAKAQDNFRKAIVKYLEPQFVFPSEGEAVLQHLSKLDMQWVKETNREWYELISKYKRKYPTGAAYRAVTAVRAVVRNPSLLTGRSFGNVIRDAIRYVFKSRLPRQPR
jgi:glycosyltransferase involved in cell wall biosynthesis